MGLGDIEEARLTAVTPHYLQLFRPQSFFVLFCKQNKLHILECLLKHILLLACQTQNQNVDSPHYLRLENVLTNSDFIMIERDFWKPYTGVNSTSMH